MAEVLHAYCVRRAGEPGPERELVGIDGSRVELLEDGKLGLWVSAGAAGPATVERLRDHDRVVRAALRTATPLPMRFGTNFADAGQAMQALSDDRERFLAALERLAGRVEMGVRVFWQPPAPGGEGAASEPDAPVQMGPGRAYLERRRREQLERQRVHAAAEAVLGEIDTFFKHLADQTTCSVLPEPGVAGALAHLVHKNNLRQYRERVEQASSELSSIRLQVTGPWAPYSFV